MLLGIAELPTPVSQRLPNPRPMPLPYNRRVTTFVVMAGLPGTGKTTLSQALAERVGGVVLSKDEVRAALFPASLIDYSVEQDDLTMDAVIRAAQYLATRQRVPFVFLDGRTFSHTYQVEHVIAAAGEFGARWKIVHLWCPEELARKRLAQSAHENHLARNRDFNLYLELQATFQPILRAKLDVDTSASLEACVSQCTEFLAG